MARFTRFLGLATFLTLGITAMAYGLIVALSGVAGCEVLADLSPRCEAGGALARGLFHTASVAGAWGWLVLLPVGLVTGALWIAIRIVTLIAPRS